MTCCKAVLTVLLKVFWCSSFCCSSAASMWICSVTLCSASSRFSWSMRRCAWAIRAFRSSSDSLPANRQNNVQHHHKKKKKKEHNCVPIPVIIIIFIIYIIMLYIHFTLNILFISHQSLANTTSVCSLTESLPVGLDLWS